MAWSDLPDDSPKRAVGRVYSAAGEIHNRVRRGALAALFSAPPPPNHIAESVRGQGPGLAIVIFRTTAVLTGTVRSGSISASVGDGTRSRYVRRRGRAPERHPGELIMPRLKF